MPEAQCWRTALVVCRVCDHEHVAVWPETADETALECPHCHSMSCEPQQLDPP